jgi:hypothetical protein
MADDPYAKYWFMAMFAGHERHHLAQLEQIAGA